MLTKNTVRSDDTAAADAAALPSSSSSICCCFGSSSAAVVDAVVEFATVQTGSLRAAPPLMLNPGYANDLLAPGGSSEHRGVAPPAAGTFEIVNKSKYPNEIIGVLVSPIAADLALKKQRDVLAHLEYLRHGCLPSQTVMHASFDTSWDVLEVALFYGCKHTSVDALTTVPDISSAFEHVKGYRVVCKGRNVLLKYKDGVGLEPQKGEKAGLFGKKKKSVGGRLDMNTNVQVLELVHA